MTRLHDALDRLAGEVPRVDLADRALQRARRQRGRTIASLCAAALLLGGGGAVAVNVTGGDGQGVTSTRVSDVLPEGNAGPLRYAYMDWCQRKWQPGRNTSSFDEECAQWRVVAEDGQTYRLPQALGVYAEQGSDNNMNTAAPLAISLDGRHIAYYNEADRRFAVRDLSSGAIWPVPLTVTRESLVATPRTVRLSADGRYVAVSGAPETPGVLFDIAGGGTVPIRAGWWPKNIAPGGETLITNEREIQVLSLTGMSDPVRVRKDLRTRMGDLAADGRTIVTFEGGNDDSAVLDGTSGIPTREEGADTVTTFDAMTGRVLSSERFRSAPKQFMPQRGSWLNADEVVVREPLGFQSPITKRSEGPHELGEITYAINVRTGQVREVARYSVRGYAADLAIPGM